MMRPLQPTATHPGASVVAVAERLLEALGLRHRDYKKFMVLSRARAGSSMLESMLKSHPNIRSFGEVFRARGGIDHRQRISRLYRAYPRKCRAIGFKIHYQQPADDPSGEVWKRLLEVEGLHVVHLRRRNVLRSIVSGKIAQTHRAFNIKDARERPRIERRRVQLTQAEVLKGIRVTRASEARFDRLFEGCRRIDVWYEDLVREPDREFNVLLAFLDLPLRAPKTRYVKMNPERLSELVVDYDELRNAFAATEWREFFDE
jgi:LPS sulfotransferase NodH